MIAYPMVRLSTGKKLGQVVLTPKEVTVAKEILTLISEGVLDENLALCAMQAMWEDNEVGKEEYLAFLKEVHHG